MDRARWQSITRLTWPQRRLAFEAALCLALSRFVLLIAPFRWIAPWLGRERAEALAEIPPEITSCARQVGWAVQAMSRHAPWESKCLVQSLAAHAMLKRRGIPHTLYLGVAKDFTGIAAHAWLRCGTLIVTGRPSHERFTVVSSFAD